MIVFLVGVAVGMIVMWALALHVIRREGPQAVVAIVRLIYTITADCDPPPSDLYFELEDDLLGRLEDKVAEWLIDHAASFSIDVSKKVEL